MLVIVKIFTWGVSPLGILVWGSALATGLLFFSRFKKTARFVLLSSLGQLVLFSQPLVSNFLLGSLENKARILAAENVESKKALLREKYSAIVLLGGATSPAHPPQRPYPDLGDAADRIWHAARLYKKGFAPKIIVSGGRSPGMENRPDVQTEAQAMRLLLIDLGVPGNALILEESSRNTRENAEKTKSLVLGEKIALVTSAYHMPRSFNNFKKAGLDVAAFPTDFKVVPDVQPMWSKLFPNASALSASEAAIKEYIALAINY